MCPSAGQEVYTRDAISFPLANTADKALNNFSDPAQESLGSPEPLLISFIGDSPDMKKKQKRL